MSFFLNKHTNLQSYDIGDYSYGSPIDILDLVDDVTLKIGKYCSIAAGVRILLGADHRTDWVTTYPFNILYSDIVKKTLVIQQVKAILSLAMMYGLQVELSYYQE